MCVNRMRELRKSRDRQMAEEGLKGMELAEDARVQEWLRLDVASVDLNLGVFTPVAGERPPWK